MQTEPSPPPEGGPPNWRSLSGLRVSFITHYTELYGANLSLLNLIEGLGKYGVQAHVICPDRGDLLDALARCGVPVAVLPFEWWVSPHRTAAEVAKRLVRNVRRLRPITAQIARWGTDLVYSNSSVFAIGALAAAELELPHVWHIHAQRLGSPGLRPSTRFRPPVVAPGVSDRGRRHRLSFPRRCGEWTPRSDAVGECPCDLQRRCPRGLLRRAALSRWSLRDRRQPFTFVLVGRFRESKGQAVALRAFNAGLYSGFPTHVRCSLLVGAAGTGDQAYFDSSCAKRRRTGSHRTGSNSGEYIPDPEPGSSLAADAALMCSWNEAMGRVTVEAMSACRPVIGFDSAAAPTN